MTDRELMQQALEALEMWCPMTATYLNTRDQAITALKERLAQPEQEEKSSTAGYVKKIESLIAERDALRERLAQPEPKPVAWTPIEQPYPLAGKLDILMGDGSILCGVLPQEEGDLWWSGTAEKFIDPQYYDITHWRVHCDTAAIRARGQDPMPLFDDWNKDWK